MGLPSGRRDICFFFSPLKLPSGRPLGNETTTPSSLNFRYLSIHRYFMSDDKATMIIITIDSTSSNIEQQTIHWLHLIKENCSHPVLTFVVTKIDLLEVAKAKQIRDMIKRTVDGLWKKMFAYSQPQCRRILSLHSSPSNSTSFCHPLLPLSFPLFYFLKGTAPIGSILFLLISVLSSLLRIPPVAVSSFRFS
jgi:hypothetical protein